MSIINYVEGDCLESVVEGLKFIPHVCNDIGGYGSGFVAALNARWDAPRVNYKKWHSDKIWKVGDTSIPFALGQVQYVQVEPKNTIICNMIGQHMMGQDEKGNAPIRYLAVAQAMDRVRKVVSKNGGSIHAPMFGAGLAGGDWNILEALIQEIWINNDIPTTIYKFK